VAKRNENLIGGIVLIALGVLFLLFQFIPNIFGGWFDWPWIIIAVGAVFLVAAVVTRTGPLAIPGCIVGGIGLILLWQNATGNWESWSYIWTLIPGFVGVGILLAEFLQSGSVEDPRAGYILLGFSFLGLVIFGSAFEFGWAVWRFWPLILIAVGAWYLFRAARAPDRGASHAEDDLMPQPDEGE